MKIKLTLLALFLFVSPIFGQKMPWDSVVPNTTSIYLEGMATTSYKSPMLGIMLERKVPIDKTKIDILARTGYWHNPFVSNSNFFVLQLGVTYSPSHMISVGGYFMNLNAFLPRPKYDNTTQQKNEGYNSPFTGFLSVIPFKNEKISVTYEYSYFTNLRRSGYRVAINYRLYKRVRK